MANYILTRESLEVNRSFLHPGSTSPFRNTTNYLMAWLMVTCFGTNVMSMQGLPTKLLQRVEMEEIKSLYIRKANL